MKRPSAYAPAHRDARAPTARARRLVPVVALLLGASLSACGGQSVPFNAEQENADSRPTAGPAVDAVLLRGAYLAPPPSGDSYPVGSDVPLYGRLLNEHAQADVLRGATSPVAASADVLGSSGTVVDELALPSREPVDLGSGGPAVVLRSIKEPLDIGEQVAVTLLFRDAGSIEAKVQVLIEAPDQPVWTAIPTAAPS